MRISYIILVLILAVGTAAVVAPMYTSSSLDALTNWGLVATILVALAIVAFYFEFEAMAMGSKEIALVAMLAVPIVVSLIWWKRKQAG